MAAPWCQHSERGRQKLLTRGFRRAEFVAGLVDLRSRKDDLQLRGKELLACRDSSGKDHTTNNLQVIYRPRHVSYICVFLNDISLSMSYSDVQLNYALIVQKCFIALWCNIMTQLWIIALWCKTMPFVFLILWFCWCVHVTKLWLKIY